MKFSVEPSLIEGARRDPEARNALIAAIWPEVYRMSAGIVRDRATAEDAAQEACAAIARSLPALQHTEAFYGWMYRIVGRCAVDAAKMHARYEHHPLREIASTEDRDALIDLRRAIAALPLAQRAAVVLTYFAGLTSAEVAAVLHVPSPTVRFHLMLARRTLRERLRVETFDAKEACERA